MGLKVVNYGSFVFPLNFSGSMQAQYIETAYLPDSHCVLGTFLELTNKILPPLSLLCWSLF